jgi:hypothetical protein
MTVCRKDGIVTDVEGILVQMDTQNKKCSVNSVYDNTRRWLEVTLQAAASGIALRHVSARALRIWLAACAPEYMAGFQTCKCAVSLSKVLLSR